MTVAAAIDRKLRAALAPVRLDIADESAQHAGHLHPGSLAAEGGAGRAGETHFRLVIVSERFAGQSRVARQRLIYQLLAEELAGGVHALAMTTLTPSEFAQIDA
ncbi:MAG TPA: BolA family protein [Alphaproteobacteria bacterium]|nr:BolA family protein [Alphaproteobacteria bacterium]